MNTEQLEKIATGSGFIAALDQSGGSTPKALKAYGIEDGKYAFYVWLAYGVSTLTVITLFVTAKRNHSKTLRFLQNKYSRS